MRRRKRKLTLMLPDEFLDLCAYDLAEPERVLRGFIAHVSNIESYGQRADGYNSNRSGYDSLALNYYLHVDRRCQRRSENSRFRRLLSAAQT